MKHIAIIYATKTKHSKKLADAIGNAIGVEAKNIDDQPLIKDVDLLFIVGGIYGGLSSPKLLEFVQTINQQSVKEFALVTSCLSKRHQQKDVRNVMTGKGAVFIDEFVSRGALLFLYMRHPNKTDMEDAVAFATRIIDNQSLTV